ncbi:MAG: MFS transporter [Anaerolineales bacterium]|nr:MFS transporter [Anaerolineales bacterium]
MSTSQSAPILTPLMRWFMFALVLANIAGQMSPMLMPIYLTQLGASISQVGLVFTLTSVVILALQVMGGWISDNIGRLRAIAIGSIGGILGFVALLLAPTWQWMLVALAIYQIPFSLVGPSAPAFIAENSTEENRGKVYGLTGTIYQITGVIGPALGGLLAGMWGFKRMLLVAAMFYTVAAGLRIWMATAVRSPEEKQAAPLSLASFKSSLALMAGALIAGGVITWILITDGIGDIAFRMSHELQPLYLQRIAGLSIQQIGLLGSIHAVATMFTPMLSGRLSDQYGERLPIATGFLLTFGGYLIFLRAGTFALFAGAWVIFGVSAGLLEPAYQSLISKVVPANRLGMFSGLFWSSLGVLSLPAPWLGAQLWDRIDPRTPFVITAIASLLMLPPVWLKFKAPQKAPVAQET